MYVYQKSFLKKKDSNAGYKNYDVRNTTLRVLFDDYIDGYLVLTHSQLKGTFYMTMEDFRASTVPLRLMSTVNNWLSTIGNVELPVSKKKPEYQVGLVTYSDAVLAGFDIQRTGRLMAIDANISNQDKIDLFLRKNVHDKQPFYNHMLTTVNGYLHRCFSHEDGIAIANGGETFNISKVNNVGVLSLIDCGRVRQIEIQEHKIYNATLTTPLNEEVILQVDSDLEGKVVCLSLAGRPIIDSRIVEIVSQKDGLIRIRTKKINLIDLIFDCVNDINLDSLGVFSVNRNKDYNKVRVQDLMSDIALRKLFSLPQSFVIVLEADDIVVEREAMQTTGLTSVYEHHEDLRYPIMTSRNRMVEYWKRNLNGIHVINVHDDVTKFRMYQTNVEEFNERINGMSPTYKWYHDKPEILKVTVSKRIKQ